LCQTVKRAQVKVSKWQNFDLSGHTGIFQSGHTNKSSLYDKDLLPKIEQVYYWRINLQNCKCTGNSTIIRDT
jgi:hypothetical protein